MAPSRDKHPKKAPASAPSLTEAGLSKLTAKIDNNLAGAANGGTHRGKRKRQGAGEKESDPKKKKPAESQHVRPQAKGSAQKQVHDDKSATLLEEIKALGGDEADLELVTGIDSDAEEGQQRVTERPVDKDFKGELAKFASGLGFDAVRDEALGLSEPEVEEEEVEEEEEDHDEEEEDEDLGEESKETTVAPVAKANIALEKPSRRNSVKLVSKHLSFVGSVVS